jgi:hypothetical protein
MAVGSRLKTLKADGPKYSGRFRQKSSAKTFQVAKSPAFHFLKEKSQENVRNSPSFPTKELNFLFDFLIDIPFNLIASSFEDYEVIRI